MSAVQRQVIYRVEGITVIKLFSPPSAVMFGLSHTPTVVSSVNGGWVKGTTLDFFFTTMQEALEKLLELEKRALESHPAGTTLHKRSQKNIEWIERDLQLVSA